MLHRCNVRDGEGWRGGDRTDEARERHENHGNRGSSWIVALGQHACRQSPRSSAGTLCFDFYMIEAKPENLIGDRAYDSDPLDEELRKDGIEMIAPHRSKQKQAAHARSATAKPLYATLARGAL